MGENHPASTPSAIYGGVLLGAALAYTILVRTILAHQPPNSKLHQAIGPDTKGYISLAMYLTAIPVAYIQPLAAEAF